MAHFRRIEMPCLKSEFFASIFQDALATNAFGTIIMSTHELGRLKVVRAVCERRLRPEQTARRLTLSLRQVERVVQRYDAAGIAWADVFIGGGTTTVTAAVSAGLAVGASAHRVAPLGLIEIGALRGLPALPPSEIVLHPVSRIRSRARPCVRLQPHFWSIDRRSDKRLARESNDVPCEAMERRGRRMDCQNKRVCFQARRDIRMTKPLVSAMTVLVRLWPIGAVR
jgi:hypothetical protein